MLGSALAQAQEWVPLNPRDRTMVMALDVSSVRTEGVHEKAWFRKNFAAARPNPGGKMYRSSVEQIYFDCSTKSQAPKVVHYYSEADGKGDVVEVWRPRNLTFLEAPPGSLGDAGATIVCRGR